MVTCSNKVVLVGSVLHQRNNDHLLMPTTREIQRLAKQAHQLGVADLPEAAPDTTSTRALRRRLSPGTVEEIVRRYRNGDTTPQLCEAYAISKGGLLKLLREEEVKLRNQPVPQDVITQATVLYERGMTIALIADRFDVKRESLRRGLVNAGTKMRLRGQRVPLVAYPSRT